MPKILIIRFSSIGDIVWTTPIVRCVKEQIPQCELHFVTKASYAEMLAGNPYIDKLFLLKDDLAGLTKELSAEKYDYVIDLHKNLRTLKMKFSLSGKKFTYNKYVLERWLFVKFKINKMPPTHIIDRYFDAVAPLGVRNDGKGLDYFILPAHEVDVTKYLPVEFQDGYTVYVIGGSEATKKLPHDKMLELCQKINTPVVLIGGKEDVENGDRLVQVAKFPIVNLAGKLTISQSASVVKQAKRVFGHDTGLTQIAAAFHDTIYSIWGTTVPLFGIKPYAKNSILLENKNLDCRPCSKAGAAVCPLGHFKCMNDLTLEFE
ncbi:MAG: lipopolysaccharide heptosyltransferase family protein [Cytophagales bacterium]|nr:MAG: lipopolysaccharide heptosyltransferase family protein [Cytophagales bacterium]